MTTPDPTDDDLAAACGTRDGPDARRAAEAAFRTLYDRHARRLLAFLAGRVDAATADDVHQDVWQRVWQHLPNGFAGGSFRAWLYQIARNAVTDQHRRRKPVGLPADEPAAPRAKSADDVAVEAELHAALKRCLDKLHAADPAVADLVRARVGGESYDDIGARTGVPADKAYRAFYKAKEKLQACVERRAS